jgi:hypothetical protein
MLTSPQEKSCQRRKASEMPSSQWRQDHREQSREYERGYLDARLAADPSYTRSCHLKRKYGITHNDYLQMLDEQEGVCAACGKPPLTGKLLLVDHCHRTGSVRGLLCNRCNILAGFLESDNRKVVETYLEKYNRGP